MYNFICDNYLENIEMTEYKDSYNELKKNINSENSKIISFLFFGILLGRLFEKYRKLKKSIFKKRF